MIDKGVEMEQGKNRNGLIILLAVLVVILAVLCVLFAMGTINLKSDETFNNNNEQTNEKNNESNTTVNNSNTDKVRYYKYSGQNSSQISEIELTTDNRAKYYNADNSYEGTYYENNSTITLVLPNNKIIVLAIVQDNLIDITPNSHFDVLMNLKETNSGTMYEYNNGTYHQSLELLDGKKAIYTFGKRNSGGADCSGTYIENDEVIIFNFDYKCYTLENKPYIFIKKENAIEFNGNYNNTNNVFSLVPKNKLELIK